MPSPNSLVERISHKVVRNFPGKLVDLEPARPIVSFSFDDVPVSARANGAAILEKHGVQGTFFVAGGIAGATHDGQVMLGTAEYRELHERGHEIGHHTYSHRTPWRLGGGYATDIARNDTFLADIVGAPTRNFAFPYGRSSIAARDLAKQRFRSARGVETGVNRLDTDLYLLRAVGMEGHMRARDLILWVDDVVATPGWLIFLTHDVQEQPSPHGTTPAILDDVVGTAIAAGCQVLTIDAALDALRVAR
jgi:peptidoglycan/xylan/chitin deacetylase (PgdA/CDA1 family)